MFLELKHKIKWPWATINLLIIKSQIYTLTAVFTWRTAKYLKCKIKELIVRTLFHISEPIPS